MSLLVTLLADGLVAVLLVATIVSSVRLSRRIAQLKGDETALRQTIGDLMVASNTAERAIAGLRNALDECDRTLAERLATAGRYAADLGAQVEAGESVIARIGAIVAQMRPASPREPEPARRPAVEAVAAPAVVVRAPAQPAGPHGDRLDAAAAAALAMTERALNRVRSRAA